MCQQKQIAMNTYQESDKKIAEITKNVVAMVPPAKEYGIMTACFIQGEFVLVTDYIIDKEDKPIRIALEKAAAKFENVIVKY